MTIRRVVIEEPNGSRAVVAFAFPSQKILIEELGAGGMPDSIFGTKLTDGPTGAGAVVVTDEGFKIALQIVQAWLWRQRQ